MVVFKCDICGETFPNGLESLNHLSIGRIDINGYIDSDSETEYHICPLCLDALYSLFEQRSQKDKFETKL